MEIKEFIFMEKNNKYLAMINDCEDIIVSLKTFKLSRKEFDFIRDIEFKIKKSQTIFIEDAKELVLIRNKYFHPLKDLNKDEINEQDIIRTELHQLMMNDVSYLMTSLRKAYKKDSNSFSEEDLDTLCKVSDMVKKGKIELNSKDFFNLISLRSRFEVETKLSSNKDLGLIVSELQQKEIRNEAYSLLNNNSIGSY